MARRERQHDRVFGRGSLQLEIELAAETFAERETPRAVDPAAERRMNHQLHAARFVEETLEHDGFLRGKDPQRSARRRQIVDKLLRRRRRHADRFNDVLARRRCVGLRGEFFA